MTLILLSFLAGFLTVLAPCAFMLLPVIVGGSISNHKNTKWRPYIITLSLAVSLFLFTVLLKATSLLINIDPVFLQYFSGVTIILLGIISLFPNLWDTISFKLNLAGNSDKLLQEAGQKNGLNGAIFTGLALGPVFSACSPTYVYILTTVLRQNLAIGLINMLAYILGLSLVMLGAGLLGQKFVKKLKWAANPNGLFKKIIAVIFILVGVSILGGFDKKLQANFAPLSPVEQFEKKLLQKNQQTGQSGQNNNQELLNVNPPTKAPEIVGINDWINSDSQSLEKLKGKVVLIDFWTYSCVNCLRTSPYLNAWHDNYKDKGLVILGLHAPEFAFEKNKENVEKSVRETYKAEYPVGLDNNFETWDAYKNQFWPAKYLIDKEGNLRYTHFGEGDYEETEKAIQTLLELERDQNLATKNVEPENRGSNLKNQTPETYLGWARSANFANQKELFGKENKTIDFEIKNDLNTNEWSLGGSWTVKNKELISENDTNKLKLKFNAKEVYLVMGSEQTADLQVQVNGKIENLGSDVGQDGVLKVDEFRMYKIVKNQNFVENSELEITVPKGIKMNAFTFG